MLASVQRLSNHDRDSAAPALPGSPLPWLLLALLLPMPALRAQYSPNCERNGRRDHCALTPNAAETNERQTVQTVVFADHSVYSLLLNEASCRQLSASVRTCNASITSPPGGEKRLPAYYRGTYYEGGYKHEYVARGLHIVYYFLD